MRIGNSGQRQIMNEWYCSKNTVLRYTSQFALVSFLINTLIYLWTSRTRTSTVSLDLQCDQECMRFRTLLTPVGQGGSWPHWKPMAAVVMLIGKRHQAPTETLVDFLHNFDQQFNTRFRYPLIVFHDIPDLNATEMHTELGRKTQTNVFFQFIKLTAPPSVNLSAITDNCFGLDRFGLGYRHMCRFHAKTIYEQAIMKTNSLEYVWRLDDDSRFASPLAVDIFQTMRVWGLKYGYHSKRRDMESCVEGLWPAAERYWEQARLNRTFLARYPWVINNNFEISAMSLWRSKHYVDYINYIDSLGGIYYSRWGDHAIKTLAINRLVKHNEIHQFSDVVYEHGRRRHQSRARN